MLAHPGYLMQLSTGVMVNVAPAGAAPQFGFLEPTINPMIYGYALPLFAGLVLATPLTRMQRAAAIARRRSVDLDRAGVRRGQRKPEDLGIDAGAQGAEAVQQAGLSLNLIALCYQFGYLILPSLAAGGACGLCAIDLH